MNLIEELYIYYSKIDTQWHLTAFVLATVSVIIMLIVYRLGKIRLSQAAAVCILVFYLVLVFGTTVLSRQTGKHYRYELELFWTYRRIFQDHSYIKLQEVLLNILLLMPYGILMPVVIGQRKNCGWITVLSGFLISETIEGLQLILKRGLFEWDDMFHNTLGAAAGYLLYTAVRNLILKHRHGERDKNQRRDNLKR